MNEYNWTTCALHALNLTLSSPTEVTLGLGGLGKRTALQLLHSAYNLSQHFKDTEWSSLWKLLTGMTCTQLKAPVLSRWECVAEACEHIVKNKNRWIKVATHIIYQEKSDLARYTIASHLYSLLMEPMIILHIHFPHAYCQTWWLPHFLWNKHIDLRTKQLGFLAHHMMVRYSTKRKIL